MLVRQKFELHFRYRTFKRTCLNHSITHCRPYSANSIPEVLEIFALQQHPPQSPLDESNSFSELPKLQPINHASEDSTRLCWWKPQDPKNGFKANYLGQPCVSRKKRLGHTVENPTLSSVAQSVELTPCLPVLEQTVPSRNALQKLPGIQDKTSHHVVLTIDNGARPTINARRRHPFGSCKLNVTQIRLYKAYHRQHQIPSCKRTACNVTSEQRRRKSELTKNSTHSGMMRTWYGSRNWTLLDMQKSGHGRNTKEGLKCTRGTTSLGPFLRPLAMLHDVWQQQDCQVKTLLDEKSHMGPNCIRILSEMRNKSQARVLDSTVTAVPNHSPRFSTFSHYRKTMLCDAQNTVKTSKEARSAAMYISRHGQHRFASNSAIRGANRNNNADSIIFSTNAQHDGNVRKGIRTHLREWESTKKAATSNPHSSKESSHHSPQRTLNGSWSSQNDENRREFDPEDDLDEVPQMDEAYAENSVDVMRHQKFTKPGELIDLSVDGGSIIAIVIGETSNVLLAYSERGTWHTTVDRLVRFSLPNFVSSDLASRLAQYVPALNEDFEDSSKLRSLPFVSRDAGSALLAKMARFRWELDAVFRKYADRISRAYDILVCDKSEGPSSIRLEDAALRLLDKNDVSELTPAMLLTVHRTLVRAENILSAKVNQRRNPVFTLLPRKTLARLELVHQWVREYQEDEARPLSKPLPYQKKHQSEGSTNPLAGFAAKARRVILSSRQNRPLSSIGTIGPSLVQFSSSENRLATSSEFEKNQEFFDYREQQIIGFLADWSLAGNFNPASPFNSVGSTILRATRMYHSEALDRVVGTTMLQEMGIINPWEHLALFDSNRRLPSDDLNDPNTCLLNDAHQSLSQSPVPLKDSMFEYRRSWGDSTIFCIDGQGTTEIDDGISIESIEGDEDMHWIHIHIANPSAFLSEDSPVANYARHLCATVYPTDDRFYMLDSELSSKKFSLADGRPCITFSAKVSSEGDMVEKTITHGILRGVRFLTPQNVVKALDLDDPEAAEKVESPLLRVGSFAPSLEVPPDAGKKPRDAANLDAKSLLDLKKLFELSKALERNRLRNGALPNSKVPRQDLVSSVSFPSSLPHSMRGGRSRTPTIHLQHSRHAVSDPVVSIHRPSATGFEVKDLVAELMVLAGYICAVWCSERNMPVPYFGTLRNPNISADPVVYRKEVLDLTNEADSTYERKWRTYKKLLGTSQVSSRPIEHTLLGLPAYCKTTSPLRRYSDLLTHWQIEAAIRHEHTTGNSLVGVMPELYEDTGLLPFSDREVEETAQTLWIRQRENSLFEKFSREHWAKQALYRAFYFQEAALPAAFEVSVRRVREGQGIGILNEWMLLGLLHQGTASDREGGFQIEDVWEVELSRIHPLRIEVDLQPLHLIRRMVNEDELGQLWR